MSHAGYLRDHDDGGEAGTIALVRTLWALGEEAAELPASLLDDCVQARLPTSLEPQDRGLLAFALRLALRPGSQRARHLDALRALGIDEDGLADVVHVVACFSYMNRLADGLGVAVEERKRPWARVLLGDEALALHDRWARGEDSAG